jgi:hypothetical protein
MPSSNDETLLKAIELYEKLVDERYETLLRTNQEYFDIIDGLMAESLKKKELALASLSNACVNES